MHREYHKWYSDNLQRDMELLVFGHDGAPVLFFPTRTGRFYDYEDWKVLEGLQEKLEGGRLRVCCVDSVDIESFYNAAISPADRIKRHMQYEDYVVREVIPFLDTIAPGQRPISAGCSMGAFHAMNITLRQPGLFSKVVAMSGRYDLTVERGNFRDLFDGFWNEDIYFNMPSQYIANLDDPVLLAGIRNVEILIALGKEDVFLENNELLSRLLWEKNIPNSLFLWDEEAHRPRYWRQMVHEYL